ncbi:hypothetical protein OSTOST_13971, partial [Ostertagia ostertagi]
MESVNKHRKGIALFRDSHIFEIFETSVSLLEAISRKDLASLQILHIGVQLASVRRTLFNGSERQTYLEHVVAGVKRVIENPEKLTEQDIRVVIAEGRLVWLVTLIGTAVFGKTAVSNNEEHDKMDGDLVARCLKFMRISDNRLIFPTTVNANPGKGNVRLEVAFIHLLEQFRRAYIMDQITKSSPVYDKLNTELGVSDETDMLSVIVQKILTNLKYWATNEQILELSLSLLKDLSLGYTAVRKLFRLQEVQLLLSNHT